MTFDAAQNEISFVKAKNDVTFAEKKKKKKKEKEIAHDMQ